MIVTENGEPLACEEEVDTKNLVQCSSLQIATTIQQPDGLTTQGPPDYMQWLQDSIDNYYKEFSVIWCYQDFAEDLREGIMNINDALTSTTTTNSPGSSVTTSSLTPHILITCEYFESKYQSILQNMAFGGWHLLQNQTFAGVDILTFLNQSAFMLRNEDTCSDSEKMDIKSKVHDWYRTALDGLASFIENSEEKYTRARADIESRVMIANHNLMSQGSTTLNIQHYTLSKPLA